MNRKSRFYKLSVRENGCVFVKAGVAIILLVGILWALPVLGQTTSGPLTSDEIWSGTVTLTGDVTIPVGFKLSIQPGTTVIFTPNSDDQGGGNQPGLISIEVNGELYAVGTPSQPIRFTGTPSNPGDPGVAWDQIRVIGADNPVATIKNCIIEYAVVGFAIYSGYAELINNTIVKNTWGGILVRYTSPLITNNIIFQNGAGIVVDTSTSSPTIAYNDVDSKFSNLNYWDQIASPSGGPAVNFTPDPGTGEISSDPLFVDYLGGDYHLDASSPCRNAGDPAPQFNDEDGSRNDMGAYGGPALCSLVAFYPFNGSADDESGYENIGAVDGAILTTDRFGVANSAYAFDGEDDSINVSDNVSLDITDAITLTAWIYPTAQKTQEIMRKGGAVNGPTSAPYDLSLSGTGYFVFGLHFPSSDPAFPQLIQVKWSGYETNKWTFVAGTYDGTTMKLYVNGTLVNTAAGLGNLNQNDLPLLIGTRLKIPADTFAGKLDELRIYNCALTEVEIQEIMGAAPDPCSELGGNEDGDKVCDDVDNCIGVPNDDQADSDIIKYDTIEQQWVTGLYPDGVGDACDKCPTVYTLNPLEDECPPIEDNEGAYSAPQEPERPENTIVETCFTFKLDDLDFPTGPGNPLPYYIIPPDCCNVLFKLTDENGEEFFGNDCIRAYKMNPPLDLDDDGNIDESGDLVQPYNGQEFCVPCNLGEVFHPEIFYVDTGKEKSFDGVAAYTWNIKDPEFDNGCPEGAECYDVFIGEIPTDIGAIQIHNRIPVRIDIKPGSDENPINRYSKGNIPVVIFGSDSFNVRNVDPYSVQLENAGLKLKGKSQTPMHSYKFFDNDAYEDIQVHILTQELGIDAQVTEALLTGTLQNGDRFEGRDRITIVK